MITEDVKKQLGSMGDQAVLLLLAGSHKLLSLVSDTRQVVDTSAMILKSSHPGPTHPEGFVVDVLGIFMYSSRECARRGIVPSIPSMQPPISQRLDESIKVMGDHLLMTLVKGGLALWDAQTTRIIEHSCEVSVVEALKLANAELVFRGISVVPHCFKPKPREHVQYKCPGNHDGPGCMFCDGGLSSCTACGSFEGATTTECPGSRMTQEQIDAVYAGTLDFRDGQWVNAPSGSCSSHYDMPGLPKHIQEQLKKPSHD